MTEEQIRGAIQSAIAGVKAEKPLLDLQRSHERSIAHRLALQMEPHFQSAWDVDCEYNRDGRLKKTLEGIKGCLPRKKGDDILPDIIVHRRAQQGGKHNLLVVEIKKHSAQDPCDHKKLELMTASKGHYQYRLGLYINVDHGQFTCTWYRDGKRLP